MNTDEKKNILNDNLRGHSFTPDEEHGRKYLLGKLLAEHYAAAENAVVVLSNMMNGMSYICYGHLGETLGLGSRNQNEEVDSIWEKNILDKIHPDDVAEKIAWELQFLTFISQLPLSRRSDYYLQHYLRIQDGAGEYHILCHRIFYLDYDAQGNVLLALCLYTAASLHQSEAGIVCSLTDTLIKESHNLTEGLLSGREREILEQIAQGMSSKQIAETLYISSNTVNNHRQNILRKLHCQNTTEAVVVARRLGLLHAK